MEKKHEILQAANECFLQYGYSKTSMRDIGRKVNLNKASIYYHYKDKFSLYKEVVLMHRNMYLSELEGRLKQTESACSKILLFIEEEVKFSQRTSVIITNDNNNIFDTKMDTKEVYYEILEDDIQRIEKLLQLGIEQNEIKPCDTKKVAAAIMKLTDAMLNANCPLYVEETKREAIYEQINVDLNFMMRLMINGLKEPNKNM